MNRDGWATGPDDGYFYQHLAYHLRNANRLPELRALLLDLDWMNAKLDSGNIPGLLADYDSLASDPAVRTGRRCPQAIGARTGRRSRAAAQSAHGATCQPR